MSAILSADDLNDFISPGVACIKPVETLPSVPPPPPDTGLENEVVLDGHRHDRDAKPAPPAQISLTDCLACSGCVTSAEAVLVSLQSHAEVLGTLDSGPALRVLGPDADGNVSVEGLEDESRKLFVASVSPQTRASLAAACGRGVTEKEAGHMVESLFRGEEGLKAGGRWHNGFTWVVDTNPAREACLVLGADEVLGAPSGTAVTNGAGSSVSKKLARPMLASTCPGWVCYAEKTHPYVLPNLSRVKSPQALTGTMLKTVLSRKLRIPPDRIWHLAIMPCFDKKLEASREELTDNVWAGNGQPGRGVRDVDCVITSKEILMLAESRGLDFFALSRHPLRRQDANFPDQTIANFLFPNIPRHNFSPVAGTSGGNLYYILQNLVSRHPGSRLQTAKGRNTDVVEYSITSESGEELFKAARYYGFRNIQNLVRRLKPAKPSRMPGGRPFGSARKPTGKSAGLEYAYVEVMACPGGCTNGGGQIKADDPVVAGRKGLDDKPGPQEQKDWLAQVDEAYFSADEAGTTSSRESEDCGGIADDAVDGIPPSRVRDTLVHWSKVSGIDLDRLVYTSFREVISDVGKETTTDTQRAIHLAGQIGGGW